MQFKKSLMFFSVFALAILALSLASAAQIFFEGFESGTLTANGWTVTSSSTGTNVVPWNIVQNPGSAATGNGFAEARPGTGGSPVVTAMQRTISTTGFQNIVLTYNVSLGDTWESPDAFNVSWSIDGITYSVLETLTSETTSYAPKTFSIPVSNNANLRIRFECSTSAAAEFCRVDNVKLEGTAIPPTISNLTISGAPLTPITYNANLPNVVLTLSNAGSTPFTAISMSEVSPTLFGATFNPSSGINLAGAGTPTASQTVNVILSSLTNLKFGTNNLIVRAQAQSPSGVSAQAAIPIRKTFCSQGSVGANLTLKNFDISNDGEGDEDSWELLDEIELEVEVENNNDDDEVDAVIKIGLFDSSGNDIADELDFSGSDSDEEEFKISIDEGDKETVTYNFKVPADFDSGNHKLAFKVFDDDQPESQECKDQMPGASDGFFEAINIEKTDDRDKSIIVDDIMFDNTPAACSEIVTGEFTVFNIGDDDEDQVKITMKNSELSLNEEFIVEDLDEGEDEIVQFSFRVPAGAENKEYRIDFRTEFDYDDGFYDRESEDAFPTFLDVTGCSGIGTVPIGTTPNVLITASLESEAKTGEELVVEATITNTGSAPAIFVVSAKDYNNWASLDNISETSLTLDAGESETVTLTFIVDEDAAGAQTFDIQASSGTSVKTQEVEVNIEGSPAGGFNFSDNKSLIWIIALVNVILIVLIIFVAVRVARR